MSVNSESQAGEITGLYGQCPYKPTSSNFIYLSPAETADSIAKGASPYHLEPGIVVKSSLSYAQQISCSSSGRPYLVGLGDFSCGCLLARIALRHVSQELVNLVLSQWGYTSASGKDEVAQRDGPHLGRSRAACEVDRAVKLDEIVAGAGCTGQREESK